MIDLITRQTCEVHAILFSDYGLENYNINRRFICGCKVHTMQGKKGKYKRKIINNIHKCLCISSIARIFGNTLSCGLKGKTFATIRAFASIR